MAEEVGFLRDDATYGEKESLRLLSRNLPKEYFVYVETHIHKKRELRFPDFIVLTNYGVIVLEVKDWVMVEKANPHGATIRTRSGESRREPNPVTTAREYAILLSNNLNQRLNQAEPGEAVPWGYAAVLINLPPVLLSQLGRAWGEEFVLGRDDLSNPDRLTHRLRNTVPLQHMRNLTKREIDHVRATIYPEVEFVHPDRPAVILDQQQERIVAEPVKAESAEEAPKAAAAEKQISFFPAQPAAKDEAPLPSASETISRQAAIRLVRGFSGSGKTIVLIQRAKYLAARYPEWKICVLTYNKPLQEQLRIAFQGTKIYPRTFHSLCRYLTHFKDDTCTELEGWIANQTREHPVLGKLGRPFVCGEINWLRDMGVTTLEAYLGLERHGRQRLAAEARRDIFTLLASYRAHLQENGLWDWEELPLTILQKFEDGTLNPGYMDAMLIDEAQDWAPVWFRVIQRVLNPEHGYLFLADDPSQSIFRHYSWREKSVNIVGRTRWLRVPYRNTFEIYQAAFGLIADHAAIQAALSEEGELVEPEVSSEQMRHGPRPLIQKCRSAADELVCVKNRIDVLRREGLHDEQIAVLARYRSDLQPFENALKGYRVVVHPIHSFKGLEMEAVIIPHIHKTFSHETDETAERRLMYMAMSRARSALYMTYSGRLPRVYEELCARQQLDRLE